LSRVTSGRTPTLLIRLECIVIDQLAAGDVLGFGAAQNAFKNQVHRVADPAADVANEGGICSSSNARL
jgi:hypothetical protein